MVLIWKDVVRSLHSANNLVFSIRWGPPRWYATPEDGKPSTLALPLRSLAIEWLFE